ncbi:MAG TPA: HAMP domain-containing sensor histidine kinase, partial [Methylomirabilota bacterium]|nr:HAMP domain-containing sensor histidine kinase [Methylomirabilota bacterium]
VNALLYSTQLDMGTKDFELTPQDLGGMVSEAVKDTKSLLDEKQVTVEITTEPNMAPVTTDHEALKTAISYLVNNAARYGQDSANNRISITVKHEGGKGVVTVRDSGVGIPDEDQSKIFTRLFRANNAVTSFPDGVGLGLYVAKTIVERMGGHIGFNSKLGEGSAFYISLPLDNTPRAKAIAEPDGSVI